MNPPKALPRYLDPLCRQNWSGQLVEENAAAVGARVKVELRSRTYVDFGSLFGHGHDLLVSGHVPAGDKYVWLFTVVPGGAS